MLTPNDAQLTSPTDRAVKIAAAVLLPTVFGFFVVRHMWLTPEANQESQAVSAETSGDANQVVDKTPIVPVDVVEESIPQVVQTIELSHRPVHPRVSLTTSADVGRETLALSHAPLELSDAGRIIADPLAFAPRSLPERELQELRKELADAAELRLYGAEPDAKRRFNDIKLDVNAEHQQFLAKQKKVFETATRGELARRRARTKRGRRDIQVQISAAMFGTADPFRASFQPLKNWMNGRVDLQGLPLAMGDECRIDSSQADELQSVSATFQNFRRHLLKLSDHAAKEVALLKAVKEQRWHYRHIPGLMQVLSAEKEPLRLELVRILSKIRYPQSTSALARLAVFDLSVEVRARAVVALQTRRPEDYRDKLLSGLRYVWPPAANNAARALVSLDDRDAYDQLVEIVRKPDPLAPFLTADSHWATKELVRVNHMQNCLLCHAPAVTSNARVTAAVPSPYDPLPRVYYNSPGGFLARADVTYLRQNFSVVHAVEDHGPWPAEQRFDYFVRERSLSEQEAVELSCRYSNELYPQRAAVLFAMRKLGRNESGDDRSSSTKPLLSSAD